MWPDPGDDLEPILEKARAGDRDARNALAAATAAELRAFVDRSMGERLRRQISAEDICQDAFVQALDAIHALNPDATQADFLKLLLRNARWIVIDRGRYSRRFAGESVSPARSDAIAQPIGSDTRAGEVTRADDMRWMHALIERLDPRFGTVIAGRLAGKGFSEIAAETGDSEANVRKRFQRAVAALKQFVTDRQLASNSTPSLEQEQRVHDGREDRRR